MEGLLVDPGEEETLEGMNDKVEVLEDVDVEREEEEERIVGEGEEVGEGEGEGEEEERTGDR